MSEIVGEVDTLDEACIARAAKEQQAATKRFIIKVAIAAVVAAYIGILYLKYQVLPTNRTLIYLVVTLVILLFSDPASRPDRDEVRGPYPMRFGMGVFPIYATMTTALALTWIGLALLLIRCYVDVERYRDDPLSRLTPKQREEVRLRERQELLKSLEQYPMQ